nr:unnamed protein product [Callosobruchus analis]
MSSSDDSDDTILLMWWRLRQKKKRKKREHWVHPALTNLISHGGNICARELRLHPIQFQNCYRLTPKTFDALLNLVEPLILKQDSNCRACISPTERLLITLRYLATGCSFMALSHIFMRGNNTIGIIVKECVTAIWDVLQPILYASTNRRKMEINSKAILRIMGPS